MYFERFPKRIHVYTPKIAAVKRHHGESRRGQRFAKIPPDEEDILEQ